MNVSFLLESEASQGGIPSAVWIILGIIVAIALLVIAIKSFWISKSISTILSVGGIVYSIIGLTDLENLGMYAIMCGMIFSVAYIFLMGNMMFDSETEGDYLIAGSLVHDTNHPFKAFCGYVGGILCLAGLVFWAAYAWTFVIALIAFILTLGLCVAMIIERIRG